MANWKASNSAAAVVNPQGKSKAPEKKQKGTGLTSSFMMFCKEKREELKKSNPQIKPQEISQFAGQAWNLLSDAEKALWK